MTGPRGPHPELRWLDDTRDLADQDYASGHLTEFWRAQVGAHGEVLVCDRCIVLEHVGAGAITPRQELAPRITEVTLTGERLVDPTDPSWQHWGAAP